MSEIERARFALDILMERISSHLDTMASKVLEVEEMVGASFQDRTGVSFTSETIKGLQSLDFLRQSLEDLALLSHFLSKNSSAMKDGTIPTHVIASKLKLESTRSIFLDPVSRECPSRNDEGIDLF